jgi:hypothetical protein
MLRFMLLLEIGQIEMRSRTNVFVGHRPDRGTRTN